MADLEIKNLLEKFDYASCLVMAGKDDWRSSDLQMKWFKDAEDCSAYIQELRSKGYECFKVIHHHQEV